MYLLEGEKTETISDRNQLRQRLAVFEKEIDDLKRQVEIGKRLNENIAREKDIIAKGIARYEGIVVVCKEEKLIIVFSCK